MTVASLKRDGDKLNEVHDRCVIACILEGNALPGCLRFGNEVTFYHDVPHILHRLRAAGVTIAACSRTTATAL